MTFAEGLDHRTDLFPSLRASIRPGGRILYETFTVKQRALGTGPTSPDHLLEPGDKWVKRRAGSFDRVLVDAPCTGIGTWRRNPDARLRLTEGDDRTLIQEFASSLGSNGSEGGRN